LLDLVQSQIPSFTLSNIEVHELKNGSGSLSVTPRVPSTLLPNGLTDVPAQGS